MGGAEKSVDDGLATHQTFSDVRKASQILRKLISTLIVM